MSKHFSSAKYVKPNCRLFAWHSLVYGFLRIQQQKSSRRSVFFVSMGKDMDSVPCGMKMNRNEARKRHATRNGRIIPLQQKQQLSSNDLAVLTPANNNAPLPPPPPPPPTPFASEIIIIPANRKHSPGRGGGKRRS